MGVGRSIPKNQYYISQFFVFRSLLPSIGLITKKGFISFVYVVLIYILGVKLSASAVNVDCSRHPDYFNLTHYCSCYCSYYKRVKGKNKKKMRETEFGAAKEKKGGRRNASTSNLGNSKINI